MGVGPFSTPVMHWLCQDRERLLISYENDKKYFDQHKAFETSLHQIKLVENWDDADIESTHWGVALIDHKPAERRRIDVKRIADKADYIIIHDSEPSQNRYYRYDLIYPLFKYRFDYPNKSGCAYTTVLSNFKDLTNL